MVDALMETVSLMHKGKKITAGQDVLHHDTAQDRRMVKSPFHRFSTVKINILIAMNSVHVHLCLLNYSQ